MSNNLIVLCDLTYTQQSIASDVMPLGIANIASLLLKNDQECQVKLFKLPEKLIDYIEDLSKDSSESKRLKIIGFSNYIWNHSLSLNFATIIKKYFPNIVVVFGGPNFPTDLSSKEVFLKKNKIIDFYIKREGEESFLSLYEKLKVVNFDKSLLVPDDIPNLTYLDVDKIIDTQHRRVNYRDMPSPYLSGLMNPFFEDNLLPIIQTNRGCPFTCTFCTEGDSDWHKVQLKDTSQTQAEIQYIVDNICIGGKSKRKDLCIADSNFGMYKEDLNTAEFLSKMQFQFNYPTFINVATGKNNKKRILRVADTLNGALKLAGSVQSTDQDVLKLIKRDNINHEEIVDLALKTNSIGANSYSEVILALPGDTKEKHLYSIKQLILAGFNYVTLYQLMLLPGTEMNTENSKNKYKMDIRYRLLPRCYGIYQILGEEIVTAEIEEICVANNTLSYDNYLYCRKFALFVNIFYNDGVFSNLLHFFKINNIDIFNWIYILFNLSEFNLKLNELIDSFIEETKNELYKEKNLLESLIKDKEFIYKHLDGNIGGNLMFKYKGLSLTKYINSVYELALSSFDELFSDKNQIYYIGKNVLKFDYNKSKNIFEDNFEIIEDFDYDILYLIEKDFTSLDLMEKETVKISFSISEKKRQEIDEYIKIFGNTDNGISRILSRIYLKTYFREAQIVK